MDRPLSVAERANPLVCVGTPLPPPVLLAAKLMVVFLFVADYVPLRPDPFVPFLGIFDSIGPDSWLWPGLHAALVGSSIALMLNRGVRVSSFAIGFVVLVSILSSRRFFANSPFLFAAALMLIGLQNGGRTSWMLRAQLVLIYFGAGLNKLLDADWRGGRYFEFWTSEILGLDWYRRLAEVLPDMALSSFFGWLTIVVELGLALAFVFPSWTPGAVAAGLAFHTGLLVFTEGRISWIFLYGMAALYLTLARWPTPPVQVWMTKSERRPWIARLDFDRRFIWTMGLGGGRARHRARVAKGSGETSIRLGPGIAARLGGLGRILGWTPVAYFAAAALFFLLEHGDW
jgi:hypothetical protein